MSIEEVAAGIAAHGNPRVYSVPGGGPSLELLHHLVGHDVDIVTPHHEAAAAIMAATEGRLRGTAGIATSIKGPGLANLLPGLSLASLESWPVVALCEAYSLNAPASKAHKRTDHAQVTAGISKHHTACTNGDDLTHALAVADAEIPGPVSADLRPEAPAPAAPSTSEQQTDRPPDEVLRAIEAARRPLVVVGTLGLRNGVGPTLSSLSVPVLTTAAAKGLVAEDLPHAGGVLTGAGGPLAPEHALLGEADLIVGIGLRSRELLDATGLRLPVALIDIPDLSLAAGLEVVATCGPEHLGLVLASLDGHSWGADLVTEARKRLHRHLTQGPFLPGQVLDAARSSLPGDARLVVDTGDFCTVAEHVWLAATPDGYLGAGQSRYMGVAIPTALAAVLAAPDRPTLVAVGDGGIGPLFGELTLAAQRRLPLVVLFMSDGALASVKGRALRDGLTTGPLERPCPAWRVAAEGLGFASARVTDLEAFEATVAEWDATDGPLFLECAFEEDAYLAMTSDVR